MDAVSLIDALFGDTEEDLEVLKSAQADEASLEVLRTLVQNITLLLDDGIDPLPPPALAARTAAWILESRIKYEGFNGSNNKTIDGKKQKVNNKKGKEPKDKPSVPEGPDLQEKLLLNWIVSTKALLDSLPQDYGDRADVLTNLNSLVRQMTAEQLTPALNREIQGMPQDTLEQKKAICEFVEKALEPLGLALKVPNTPDLPGKLKATAGNWPGVGRFQFEVYIGGKRLKPSVSDKLPILEVIDPAPMIELETFWQDVVGPSGTRPGRRVT